MLRALRLIAVAGLLASGGCGSSPAALGDLQGATRGESPDAGSTEEAAAQTPVDEGGNDLCHPVAAQHPIEGAGHVALCSPLAYQTNPPSSGDHYPIWAVYQTYATPIPTGFWVHDLEHGAVVISYNCPGGCAAEVAEAQALIDSLPNDCGADGHRLVLLPFPALDVRFAASAWGFTLRADCFDRTAFADFITAHYGQGPESICGGGIDPTGGPGGTPACPM